MMRAPKTASVAGLRAEPAKGAMVTGIRAAEMSRSAVQW